MENISESPLDMIDSTNDLSISKGAISHLLEIGRWSKFLSIIGFIGLGIMIFIGFFAGSIFGILNDINGQPNNLPFPGFVLGLVYIVMALIYLPPLLYLFNFSTKIKMALNTRNNSVLEYAFENLKSHYKYIGIFTIVVFSLYALVLISSLMMSMMF